MIKLLSLILLTAALVMVIWVGFLVLGSGKTKPLAWSEPVCGNNSVDKSKASFRNRRDLIVRFFGEKNSCNFVTSPRLKKEIVALQKTASLLSGIGLPIQGRRVQLLLHLPGDSDRNADSIKLNRDDGGNSTVDLNMLLPFSSDQALQGQSELAVAKVAPGLDNNSIIRLAGFFSLLAKQQKLQSTDYDGLALSGSYELFLAREKRLPIIEAVVKACQFKCSLDKVRDDLIKQSGQTPSKVKQEWITRDRPSLAISDLVTTSR